MKALLSLILLPVLILAQEITDLGVISTGTNIHLEKDDRRKDFSLFKIEVLPRNLRGWTNKVEFTTTNDVITLDQLSAVPEGIAIMGVRMICVNGDASPIAVFRIDVERDVPEPTKVHISHNLRLQTEQKIEHVLIRREKPGPEPPLPTGMTNKSKAVHSPAPLLGTNSSYSQYQWRLERAAREGKHRSN